MQTVIIVIHLMVVLAMTGVVLLQRSEGGGLGMGGGTGGFLTSRGSANVLTRTTATLAAVFFATSLVLSILAGWDRKPHSILEGTSPATQPGPAGAPAPLGQGGRGVLDTLRQQGQQPAEQGQPAAPPVPAAPAPAPAGPQVPQSR
jgi:preprotein translocase subunit SecG